ncbi:heavy metal efflux pump CzcA domain protein [Burkholderia pseudomallei K42]|nr:heavy metal efflux pump CzcA domain protein [Burkholderia pseudomallei K42]
MMPKSSAPRLIRFALTFALTMPVKVISIDSGITSAVITAARMLPRNRKRTAITSTAPSSRFFFTVRTAFSTSTVRSYTAIARTPAGSVRFTSAILAATAFATVRLFSPISMNTVPSTTSSPFAVAAPVRSSRPRSTAPMSFIRTGTPPAFASTMFAMSSAERAWPGTRTRYCSPRFSM